MAFRVTLNGREVRNPFVRIPLAFLLMVFAACASIFAVAMVLLAIVLLPITLPLHLVFRLCGLRGFFYSKRDGRLTYSIGTGAFHRA